MTTQAIYPERLLRINEVLKLVPIGRSTWWAGIKEGRFPKPLKLSERVTCWRERDINQLITNLGGAE